MKTFVLAFLIGVVAVGCGGTSSPDSKLVGDWIYINADGSAGLGVNFKGDGSYSTVILHTTSSTTANTQVENGRYVATDASVTFTPTEWSCTGTDAALTASYTVSGNVLALSMPSGLISFTRNTTPATGGVILTVGCFAADGSFTAQPVAPIESAMQDKCYVAPDWNIGYQDCGVPGCVAMCGVLPQDGSPGHLLPAGCTVEIGTSTIAPAMCVATCAECTNQ